MERHLSFRTNSLLLLGTILLTSISGNSFAIERRSQSIKGKDCVSCTPEFALGNPIEGNRTIKNISAVAGLQDLSDEEYKFQSHSFIYCGTLTQIGNERDFKRKIIVPMTAESPDGNMDKFWLGSHCESRYQTDTRSPIAHVAAENSTDRLVYMVALHKIYADKNDLATFTKIINAKNSRGQTTLDYISFMVSNKNLLKIEEPGLNKFVKFLCDNGAVYSTEKRKCPAEYKIIER